MKPEQWEELERTLSGLYGTAKLKIDGYNVTLAVEPYKGLKNCVAVYVDGRIKSEWVLNDSEIRRKFYQKHTSSLMSRKDKEKLKKESKAVQKMIMEMMPKNIETFSPYWTSFRSMKRHFIQNNVSIELLED